MEKQLLQVAQFMKLFKQPIRFGPTEFLPLQEYHLRRKLSQEETDEFFDEGFVHKYPMHNPQGIPDIVVNLPLALDGLCDRLYVLLGDAHSIGLGFLLPVAFRMVHESNMTKLWTLEEKRMAEQTTTNLTFEQAVPFAPSDNEGELLAEANKRYYIARNQDGKVIKSPSYQPVDFYTLFDDIEGHDIQDFSHGHRIVYGDAPEPTIEELLEDFGKDSEDEID